MLGGGRAAVFWKEEVVAGGRVVGGVGELLVDVFLISAGQENMVGLRDAAHRIMAMRRVWRWSSVGGFESEEVEKSSNEWKHTHKGV
eukprot:3257367-Rhodomonas_salina.1